jgi:DNA-directed RNA polymerase specialized sigma24 family protein
MLNGATIADLAGNCREQTERFLRGEQSLDVYCFELFRRAIVDRDDAAWTAVYNQYAGIARRWFGTKMDPEEGLPAAFERFWRAIDGEKFARFGTLAGVLSYLRMCVHTTAIDHARAGRVSEGQQSLDSAIAIISPENVESSVAENVDGASFWRRIISALDDERAIRVLHLSYVIGLTPREIVARHAHEFPNISTVYQIKRNALDRLRRSPAILE